MARRVLWGSLSLAPLTILLHYFADLGDTAEFVLAAASLIPLAWLIGEATEHAAHHTGPGIGGFLNATFGNAPELIIALFAVAEAKFEVVRGSLSGSVIGNLLLVLGFSLLFGGRGRLDRQSSFVSLGLVALAVLLLLIPAVPSWEGDPERDLIVKLSIPVSIALLVVYVAVTWVSLRRHRALHISDEPREMRGWSLPMSLGVLGVATVVTALIAEILVGSIETFAEKAHLSEFFVAAVIVAIVGNAAEHGGAVVVAARGNIKLAAEIALASSAQVAVFLIPAVCLLALLIDPLALGFRPVEIAALGGSVVFTTALLWQGWSSRGAGDRADRGLRRRRARLPARRRPLGRLRPSAPAGGRTGSSRTRAATTWPLSSRTTEQQLAALEPVDRAVAILALRSKRVSVLAGHVFAEQRLEAALAVAEEVLAVPPTTSCRARPRARRAAASPGARRAGRPARLSATASASSTPERGDRDAARSSS